MDKEWVKTITIIATMIAGFWTVFVHIDNRLDSIDSRLAKVEGWIEGRFDVAPSGTNASDATRTQSTISRTQPVTNH